MLNKMKEIFKTRNKTEFDIEVNENEVLVLKQGVETVVGSMLNDIAIETDVDKIKVMIDVYNGASNLLETINEEIEHKMEEITVSKMQLDIILEALTRVETVTTNNLKSVENPSNYMTLCKTMVIISNLTERVIELV